MMDHLSTYMEPTKKSTDLLNFPGWSYIYKVYNVHSFSLISSSSNTKLGSSWRLFDYWCLELPYSIDPPSFGWLYCCWFGPIQSISLFLLNVPLTLSYSGNCALVKVPSKNYSAESSKTMAQIAAKYLDRCSCLFFLSSLFIIIILFFSMDLNPFFSCKGIVFDLLKAIEWKHKLFFLTNTT